MKAIIFFLGITFVLTQVHCGVINSPKNVACDAAKFQACIQTFASQFGIKNFDKNVTVYAKAISQLVQNKGLEGLKQACNAGKDLKTCIGDQYDSCLTKDFLVSQGVSLDNALGFESLASEGNYACTDGLNVISQNFDCIENVIIKNAKYFEQCIKDMVKNIEQDPDNPCKYLQELPGCYLVPYKKACHSSVSDVMCQIIKLAMKPAFPQCTITSCP